MGAPTRGNARPQSDRVRLAGQEVILHFLSCGRHTGSLAWRRQHPSFLQNRGWNHATSMLTRRTLFSLYEPPGTRLGKSSSRVFSEDQGVDGGKRVCWEPTRNTYRDAHPGPPIGQGLAWYQCAPQGYATNRV